MNLTIGGILEGIIGTAIYSLAGLVFSYLIKKYIKTKSLFRFKSIKALYTQFFLWLFILLVSCGILFAVRVAEPATAWIFAKVFSGIAALLSFVFLWGVLDAAIAFPEGNKSEDEK